MKNVYVIFPTTCNLSLTNPYEYLSDEGCNDTTGVVYTNKREALKAARELAKEDIFYERWEINHYTQTLKYYQYDVSKEIAEIDEDGERNVYDYETIDIFDGAPKKVIEEYTR